MTGEFLLDWTILALSLFNTILLLWLGVTVLLNADRRSWGIALAGSGLLVAGTFFLVHSAIIGLGLSNLSEEMDWWWHLGWLPIILSAFAWYGVILWYAGFWENESSLRRRQRIWLPLAALLALALVVLLYPGKLLPTYSQVMSLNFSDRSNVGGPLLLVLIYSLYNVMCIGLALDALLRPGPSARVMGHLARRRARPWLVGASILLLGVSLLVALLVAELVMTTGSSTSPILLIAWFDLLIAALIAVTVIMIGKAVVAYEIFTRKILPRRGLFRQWRSAVILAAGYSTVLAWSLTVPLRPIYALLLATLMLTIFFALFGARSFVEREHYVNQLRPLLNSRGIYDQLFTPATPIEPDVRAPFHALCESVLDARVVYLHALGPMSALVGQPLAYPDDAAPPTSPFAEITPHSPQTLCLPLDPERYAGAIWAVPLWSERGLIGVLLLGEKRDDSLYTQEEIEIARATGERLLDTRASVELARRLIALQRQRMAESQVLDRRTRRVLHDDILPRVHAAMLNLSSGAGSDPIAILAEIHRELADLLRDMPSAGAPQVERLGLIGAVRGLLDDELRDAFDQVTWEIEPEAEQHAHTLPSLPAQVLFYATREAIRNAARYGRQGDASRALHLCIGFGWRRGLVTCVEDDGVGLTNASHGEGNSGLGLALHSTLMAVVGGSLTVESVPGARTRVTLSLPEGIWV
jgi:signal transduction histidine kinase